MTAKEIILDQMAACHNQANWFVPALNAIAGLTNEQSLQKDDSNNSVTQIVTHLIFWNEIYLKRFKGISTPKFTGENKETFDAQSLGITEIDIENAGTRLDNVLGEFYNLVKNADEEKLTKPAFESSNNSWYSYLTHITIHNAYHIGQIVTIRKQQGNWNNEQGVN